MAPLEAHTYVAFLSSRLMFKSWHSEFLALLLDFLVSFS